jgi:5-methyltetrahydrofolate--homocysteine methyltransferase
MMRFERQCTLFFLYHAIQNGMTMGIVNPSIDLWWDSQRFIGHVEDVILDRRDDATERLLDFAENVKEMVLKQMKQ